MSTDYLTDLPIRLSELHSLKEHGVSIKEDETGCILTQGNSSLHAHSESEYLPVMFTRYADNDPSELFQLIEMEYGVKLKSEHDDEYVYALCDLNVRSRNAVCPACSSENVAKILYGLPRNSRGVRRVLKTKLFVVGGCVVRQGRPLWHCNECKHKWRPSRPEHKGKTSNQSH